MIYLDYNATTPIIPHARHAMIEAFDCLGNPSSVHAHGRDARKILENFYKNLTFFWVKNRLKKSEFLTQNGVKNAKKVEIFQKNGKNFLDF